VILAAFLSTHAHAHAHAIKIGKLVILAAFLLFARESLSPNFKIKEEIAGQGLLEVGADVIATHKKS
jgi:hypothetical protein